MPSQDTILRACAHCGTEFSPRIDNAHRGDGRFCSRRCGAAGRTPPPEVRFWRSVNKTDSCWLWTAGKNAAGYGKLFVRGRTIGAHRYSWQLANGPIPAGLWALHNCPDGDNPACVNPAHLFLGTPPENSSDMVSKGRQASGDRNAARLYRGTHAGERNGRAKLTEDRVREMRALHAAGGITYIRLGELYGVTNVMARLIVSRKCWAQVD